MVYPFDMAAATPQSPLSSTPINWNAIKMSDAPVSPAVVTSKTAQNDINNIATQHATINNDIKNQATNVAAQTEAKRQQDLAKAQSDLVAKQAQLKLEIEKQNANTKTASVTGATPQNNASGGNYNGGRGELLNANGTPVAAPAGATQSANGLWYANGQVYAAAPGSSSTGGTPKTPEEQLLAKNNEYDTTAQKAIDTIEGIRNGTIPLTPAEQAMIDGLKQQFQTLISEQQLANTGAEGLGNIRGYQKGAAEYDPTFQAKTIGSIVTAGQNKIADLNTKMASAVAALTQGFKDNNIAAIKDSWTIYQDAAKNRQTALKDTIERTKGAIAEAQDKKRLSSIENSIAGLLTQGISDPKQILDYINNLEDGTPTGADLTSKELKDAITNLTGETDLTKLSTDVKDFNYFKALGLPDDIAALPANQQFLAWQKAQKEATTSDPATRYQVITDPVSGNQSIFDRQTGGFVGGQPSGTEGMSGGDAVILNAAKSLAVKDPAGGKLLVREVNDKLAKGDVQGAMDFIATAAYNGLDSTTKKAVDEFESSISLSEQALKLANESNISAGPYKALYEAKKPFALIDRDPKYAGLKQIVAQADAQIRRGFFGTAVTAAEGGTANAFLFDPTDNMEIIKNKLKGNLAFFSYVNAAEIARTTGLPKPSLAEAFAKYGVNATNPDDDLFESGRAVGPNQTEY